MKTLTLKEAESSLVRIADEAIQGESFLIERNGQFLLLKKAEILEPLEKLDPKVLKHYYGDKADAAFEDKVCSASESHGFGD